ncbi:MAG: SIMPL domain-containing protein [Candidatus Korobacteraceae bacterium]
MRFRNCQSIAFAVISFLGSLCVVAPITAQDRSAAAVPNTVWVGADGKFEAEPDTVLVQFNISAQEDKLQDANQKASRAAEQVRQLLRANGLDPKDAQVGQFSVQPVYDYKTPKRKLVGYRVDTNISIKLKDFSKVGPITEGLSNMADVTGDQSLSYLLDDMEAAKVKAVEDALPRAHAMANAVARFSGRSLGELSYASVDTYEPTPVRPMVFAKQATVGTMAAPAPPTAEFGAQKITVTAHVNALYVLK